jgi:hypothetical protein
MVSLTLSVPESIRKEMEEFPEINWSEIARAAIMRRILVLKKFREFTKDSEITEEDALRLGREVNKKATERFLRSKNEARN